MHLPMTPDLAPAAPVTPWMYGLRAYQRDQPRFFQHLVERYGDVVHWRALLDIYVINHPEDVKRILSAPSARFSKDTIDYRILAASLGRGLVTNDGAPWAHQRKLMQPMFHNRAIHPFDEPINRLTNALAERWSTLPAGQVVMVEREMGKLAFEIVGTTLFGTDIEQHAAEISEVLEVINVPTHELRSLLLVLLLLLLVKFLLLQITHLLYYLLDLKHLTVFVNLQRMMLVNLQQMQQVSL